jgi:hypothetical protein
MAAPFLIISLTSLPIFMISEPIKLPAILDTVMGGFFLLKDNSRLVAGKVSVVTERVAVSFRK